MRKNKILAAAAFLPMLAVLLAGCDAGIPEMKNIGVESIAIKAGLAAEIEAGILLETGQTKDISRQVTHSPANANDIAETYYSTDPTVAEVSGQGVITAVSPGTANIVIYVGHGNHSVDFQVEVVDVIPIPATDLELITQGIELKASLFYNLRGQVILTPNTSNDVLLYTDYDPAIIAVDEDGKIEALAEGTTSVTVTSARTPSLTATVPVVVTAFSGYYPRSAAEGFGEKQWTMLASQDPLANITDCGQGTGSALDNNAATNIALIRPGKSAGGLAIEAGGEIWFVVDMLKPRVVNSYKVIHRVGGTVLQTRFWGFDEISGSDDGENFTVITTDSRLPTTHPDASDGVADINETSHEVRIPNTESYRYIKFYAKSANCFYQRNFTSPGNAVQIQEIFLGYIAN